MKQLLLVIDLQNGWRHRQTEKAMLNGAKLCQKFKGDIIHCCFKNDKTSLFAKQLNWHRFNEAEDTAQIPEIEKLNLPVYWRSTYSCLNKETKPIVKKYDQVYIAGVFTDISVFATALALFDMNINVGVVKDCVASLHGDEAHKSALKSLDFALGSQWLVTSNALV